MRCFNRLVSVLLIALMPLAAAHAQTRQWGWHLKDIAPGSAGGIAFDPDGSTWIANGSLYHYSGGGWQRYSSQNSFGAVPDNYPGVQGVLIDRDGSKWVAGPKGVAKFDGKRWTAYTSESTGGGLVGGDFKGIAQDSKGTMWFAFADSQGVQGGVSRFDGKSWTKFTGTNTHGAFSGSQVYALLVDRSDNVWVAVSGGAYRYDGSKWQHFSGGGLPGSTYAMAADSTGAIWFGGQGVIYRYDRTGWSRFSPFANPYGGDNRKSGFFETIAVDKNDNVWVGATPTDNPASQPGLWRYDRREWQLVSGRDEWRHIRSLAFDRKNLLWIGADGLFSYDGSTAKRYEDPDALAGPSTRSESLAVAADGTVWSGSYGDVSEGRNGRWRTHTPASTGGALRADDTVRAIVPASNGVVWMGAYRDEEKASAVVKKDGARWTRFEAGEIGYPLGRINAMLLDGQQRLWLATSNGVLSYDGGRWKRYASDNTGGGLASDNVYSVALDAQGALWFGCSSASLFSGTEGGISRFDGKTWSAYTPASTNGAVPTNNVRQIAFDRQGHLWALAGVSLEMQKVGALVVYDTKQMRALQSFTDDNTDRIYSPAGALALVADRVGGMWSITQHGAHHYDGKSWSTLNREKSQNALQDDHVTSIAVDSANNTWFGVSGAGVAVLGAGAAPMASPITIAPQRVAPVTPAFPRIPPSDEEAALAAEAARQKNEEAAARARMTFDDHLEEYCYNVTVMEIGEVNSSIRDLAKTGHPVDDFFNVARCKPRMIGANIKVPVLQLMLEAPCTRGEFMKVYQRYYQNKRKAPELWTRGLNAKNTTGHTFLDYAEWLKRQGNFVTPETKACVEAQIDMACKAGASYSAFSDMKCAAN